MTAILAMPAASGLILIADRQLCGSAPGRQLTMAGEAPKLISTGSGVIGTSAVMMHDLADVDALVAEIIARGLSALTDSEMVAHLIQARLARHLERVLTERSLRPDHRNLAISLLFAEWCQATNSPSLHIFDSWVESHVGSLGPGAEAAHWRNLSFSEKDLGRSIIHGIGSGMVLLYEMNTDAGRERWPALANDGAYQHHVIGSRSNLVSLEAAQAFLLRYLADSVAMMPEIAPESVGSIGGTFDVGLVDGNGFRFIERGVELPAAGAACAQRD